MKQARTRCFWFDVLKASVVIPLASFVGIALGTIIASVTKASDAYRSAHVTISSAKVIADPSVCCCDDSACTNNCKKYSDGTCGERNKYPCNDGDCASASTVSGGE
jgi:hypothetical protein